jgi:hypothetical protein
MPCPGPAGCSAGNRSGRGRGPQGTPVECPRWTDGGNRLILLGNGCGR